MEAREMGGWSREMERRALGVREEPERVMVVPGAEKILSERRFCSAVMNGNCWDETGDILRRLKEGVDASLCECQNLIVIR